MLSLRVYTTPNRSRLSYLGLRVLLPVRDARARRLPARVIDARVCLKEYGFAFVPRFGEEFAREFLSSMGSYLHATRQAKEGKQSIASGVVQFLLPTPASISHSDSDSALLAELLQSLREPEAKEAEEEEQQADQTDEKRAAAAGAAASSTSSRRGRKRKAQPLLSPAPKQPAGSAGASAWHSLRAKWHALVRKLAIYLGFSEAELVSYHVQDEKVRLDVADACAENRVAKLTLLLLILITILQVLVAKFRRGEQAAYVSALQAGAMLYLCGC